MFEENPNKLYYSIGEVAKIFDVNTSLVRFWEKEFDVLRPKKNKKGNRLFTQEDMKNLNVIYHLVKVKGFTLQGAKDQLQKNKAKVQTETEVVQKLSHIRDFLLKIKEEL